MAWAMQCPYWRWQDSKSSTCEGCRLQFESGEERRRYFTHYCANSEGWASCPVARMLSESYEVGQRG